MADDEKRLTTRDLMYKLAERGAPLSLYTPDGGTPVIGCGQGNRVLERNLRALHHQLSELEEGATRRVSKIKNPNKAILKDHKDLEERVLKLIGDFERSCEKVGDIVLVDILNFKKDILEKEDERRIAIGLIEQEATPSPRTFIFRTFCPKERKTGYLQKMKAAVLDCFKEMDLPELKQFQKEHLYVMLRETAKDWGKNS